MDNIDQIENELVNSPVLMKLYRFEKIGEKPAIIAIVNIVT